MEEKKKRGCNYTEAEKNILLELIKKYQNIIENKETNANTISKKREAWDSVCHQYNAVAASGSRTWQQLRHLYENIKQRSKKNIAKANRLQFYEKTQDLKKKATEDKKEIHRTGGGSYRSTLTDHDAQILAMVAPQIQPLSNPYDDAALYFGDTDSNDKNETQVEASPDLINRTVDIGDQVIIMDDFLVAENSKPCTVISNTTDNQEVAMTATTGTVYQKPSKPASKSTGRMEPKHKKSNIKQQYFKTKLRNAKLENKYLINKNKMEINKYKLEMQILRLRLKKLQSTKT